MNEFFEKVPVLPVCVSGTKSNKNPCLWCFSFNYCSHDVPGDAPSYSSDSLTNNRNASQVAEEGIFLIPILLIYFWTCWTKPFSMYDSLWSHVFIITSCVSIGSQVVSFLNHFEWPDDKVFYSFSQKTKKQAPGNTENNCIVSVTFVNFIIHYPGNHLLTCRPGTTV